MRRLALLALPVALVLAAPLLAQDSTPEIAPNENLVSDGLPPIPARIAAAVASYTESRAAGYVAWLPDAREMLVATRFADVSQLHHVRSPLGARTQLTFFKDRVSRATFPRHRSDYFVFSRDVGGGEFHQNYRFDRATKTVTLLTDGKSRNAIGPWSRKGDLLAYTSTRRNRKDNDLYVVDPAKPETDRLVAAVSGSFSPLDWSPDDAKLLVGEYVSVNESYLHLYDVKTGHREDLTPLAPDAEKVSWHGGRFLADGSSVLTATDEGSEFVHLVRLDLATKKLTPVGPKIDWDVQSYDLAPDGKTVAFVTNEEGVGVLHLLDLETNEHRVPKLPPGTVSRIDFHPSGKVLAFELSSARVPQDVFSLDLETGAVTQWTESEVGPIDASTFPEPELVRWKSFDGRSISGFLYRPPARFEGKRPVLVNVHGGPEGQSRPGFLGRSNYYLNELGVALLFPNVRGSTGYGKTFALLDNGKLREDSVKDVGALFDWIATRPDLDADRVMVQGGSYGGYMALAISTHYSDRILGAIDVVGISNFVSFLERTEAYRRDLRRAEYGDERDPAMREFLASISPLTHADRIKKPLFVVQGKNDPRVPLAEAEQIVAAVRKTGTPVWYLMAKDEGHGFAKKKNSDHQFFATIRFIEEFLLGRP